MYLCCPAIYRDIRGEEATTIKNDGKILQMRLRGVDFESQFLDDFEATIPLDDPVLSAFTLTYYGANKEAASLCGYTLDFDLPLPVVTAREGTTEVATLHVSMELGLPKERGGVDREVIVLNLCLGGKEYPSSGKSGWFEDELLEIQRALPDGIYMKACINCAFGDYHVAGHGAFGGMLCFRERKSEYLQIRTKYEYMKIMESYTEIVQETYLCPEFQRRIPGIGYRG